MRTSNMKIRGTALRALGVGVGLMVRNLDQKCNSPFFVEIVVIVEEKNRAECFGKVHDIISPPGMSVHNASRGVPSFVKLANSWNKDAGSLLLSAEPMVIP